MKLVNEVLLLLIIFWSIGCYDDCEPMDIKIGEANLLTNSKVFIQQFVNKGVIYIDSLGNELTFTNTESIKRSNQRRLIRENCNSGVWDRDNSYDYIELEWLKIKLGGDTIENLTMFYTCRVIDRRMVKDTILYDDMNPVIHKNESACSMSTLLIMNKRGKTYIDPIKSDPQIILDTVILGRKFNNLFHVKREDLCSAGEIPSKNLPNEFYVSKEIGIMAFKMLDGRLWRFDRLE